MVNKPQTWLNFDAAILAIGFYFKKGVQMKKQKLEWSKAPIKTQWGDGMMEAIISINKDETASIYVYKDATPELEKLLKNGVG